MLEWAVVLVWLLALKIVQLVVGWISDSEFAKRKLVHLVVGFSVIPLTNWIQHWYVAAVPVLMILSANAKLNLKGVASRSPLYQAYSVLGVIVPLVLILYFWRDGKTQTIVAAVLMMTLGDAAAAIGGRWFGRRRLSDHSNKTLEGSLCNLLVSFTTVFVMTHSLTLSLLTATAAATIEAVVPGVWDNPAVLIAGLLILRYFSR